MRSKVAEAARREQLEGVARMSPTERVALARRIAARDLRAYAAVRKLDPSAALEAIRRSRRLGRKYSRCMDDPCP